MKKLKVSDINSSVAMPIKSGTLQFLQDAHREALAGVVSNLIETPETDKVYILSGCINSTVAPIHTISAGVVYLNGEVFDFAGASFTLSGLLKAYGRIETTQYTTDADPVEFTDAVLRNVHNVRKLVIEATATSSGVSEFKDFIQVGANLKGDTKEIVCDSTYKSINFDSSGLGRLERKGWAIMNGANGTQDDNGLVIIANGTTYPTLEATGGSVNQTLSIPNLPVNNKTVHKYLAGTTGGSGSGAEPWVADTVNFGGSATPFGIMQPYRVRLRIQKI